ncbi:MAG TPA: type IX secretion system sortase PorU, partial [Cytophagaceae bacterium]
LTSSSFTLRLNNNTIGSQPILPITAGHYDQKGNIATSHFSINSSIINNNPNLTVNLTYNKSGNNSAIGYLNYLAINVQRTLQLYNNSTLFRNKESRITSPIKYSIANANSSYKIWDVTDPLKPKNQHYTLNGDNASFITEGNNLKEYILFSGSGHPTPSFVEKVKNQNLHGITSPNLPDLVIVTPEEFLSEAQRLANFRTNFDKLSVEVVTLNQVYNEFSSGAPDVTAIRDFMKMLYDRKSGNDSIRYLLLFGDCSYDFKNRITNNTNIIPIYHSRNSLHPLKTYSSDDYFGFLDDNEGRWDENSGDNHLLDIGIGRLPVKTIDEASAMVNKIIHYHTNETTLGKWRNKITFVADDGDGNLHQKDAEKLAKIVNDRYKVYNINKLYIDAFQQISTPSGETCPALKQFLDLEVDRGTFVVNYTGHGGESGWSQENILDIPQISKWTNYNMLPFFVTATCAFGRYDDPQIVSGAEHLVNKSDGGAIGIITSTRPVYASSNLKLNEALYSEIFRSKNGEMPRLGDIIRNTKNNSISGVNNRNYALLGDPSMRLEYPEENISITKINGNTNLSDTLKALDKVTLEGEIQSSNGTIINDFNGTLYITVYDKASSLKTIGTEGSSPLAFNLRNNYIYEGKASITAGKFSVSFVVPKDISYQFDYGKVSLYAQKEFSTKDAAGNNDSLIIGGSSSTATTDNTPPEINVFMNDESFVFGGLTSPNSLLLAKISDENGINIAGTGIGHEITGVLDNKEEVIVLNEYYSAELDDYQKGKVEYPLKDLTPGNHSVRIKAWDTHNNSAEGYLEFVVANNEQVAIENVLNYPNPFSTSTTFHFDHNRAGDDLDVIVQIYTISGKLVKTIENRYYLANSHISNGLHWDARDDFGDKLGKGVYIYKVRIRSLRDGSNNFKYQKLVILN